MSGKILIVDPLATNRIVLKVKLSAAHFVVVQATSGTEALEVATLEQPDLVVANAEVSGMETCDFIEALRLLPGLGQTPIVLVLPDDTPKNRIRALHAGADDLIAQPFDERNLLARLRGLLRQHHSLQELRMHVAPDQSLGFGETQNGFITPAKVALVTPEPRKAITLRMQLDQLCPHHVSIIDSDTPPSQLSADLFLVLVPEKQQDAGLHTLAELRAAPKTRNSSVIAILHENTSKQAATLLDMGANDVLIGPVDLDELSIRVSKHIRNKQETDGLRDRLHDGVRAAMIDPLTGLYNRRFALPFLQKLIQKNDNHFAVMVADLDHFKLVNDTKGHAAGDRVLKRVANLLRINLRDHDMIARIGGEEFLIVLPNISKEQACLHADRLCRLIRDNPVSVPSSNEPIHVTISIGVTLGQSGDCADTLNADALLDQADQALYTAKAKGRNTVRFNSRSAA